MPLPTALGQTNVINGRAYHSAEPSTGFFVWDLDQPAELTPVVVPSAAHGLTPAAQGAMLPIAANWDVASDTVTVINGNSATPNEFNGFILSVPDDDNLGMVKREEANGNVQLLSIPVTNGKIYWQSSAGIPIVDPSTTGTQTQLYQAITTSTIKFAGHVYQGVNGGGGSSGGATPPEVFTLDAGMISTGVVLSAIPPGADCIEIIWNAGPPLFPGASDDFTWNAGANRVEFTAAMQAMLAVGDKIRVRCL